MNDLGTILGDGFDTWKRNLNLCIPFVLEQVLFWVAMIIIFLVIFVTALASLIPYLENIGSNPSFGDFLWAEELIAPYIVLFVIGLIVMTALFLLIDAFIWAGAIGMAKRAIETGKSTIRDMFEYGMRHFLSVLASNIIIAILSLLGFIALIPGILVVSTSEAAGVMLLIFGFLVMFLYLIFIAFSLYLARFAIVVDDVGAIEGIKRSYSVFSSNKLDLFLLAVIMVAVIFVIEIPYMILLMIVSPIPVIGSIFQVILQIGFSLIVMPLVIALITVWLTTFYIDRKSGIKNKIPPDQLSVI